MNDMRSLSFAKGNQLVPSTLALAFTVGAISMALPGSFQHRQAQLKIKTLEQELRTYRTELELTRAELEQVKPELARYLIREQARWKHATQMRQTWAGQFGYTDTIQVKTPEDIAYPNRDADQMVSDLVRLSDTAGKPMHRLIQQVTEDVE
jgi:hypothetical protein